MSVYYNIRINKSVSNFSQGLAVLYGEIQRLHYWERNRPLLALKEQGWSQKALANIAGVSKQAIANIFRNKLDPADLDYQVVEVEEEQAKTARD